MPIKHNKFWILDKNILSVEVESLQTAFENSHSGYYALCDYSFQTNGTENFYGNIWHVEKGDVRKLISSFLNIKTDSDEELLYLFNDGCFAYWKLLPTTKELYEEFQKFKLRKDNGLEKYVTMEYQIRNNYCCQ